MKARIGKLEDVEEGLRGEYEAAPEGDEGYVLKVEELDSHPGVHGLTRKVNDLIAAEKETKKKLAAYKGRDPAKLQELEDAAARAEEEAAVARGDATAVRDSTKKYYETEVVAPLQAENAELNTYLDRTMVSESVLQKSDAAGFFGELILPHVAPRLKRVRVEGGFDVRVLADDGKTERIDGATGKPMTVEQLLVELSKDPKFKPLLKPNAPSGSGSGDGPGGKGTPPAAFDLAKASTSDKAAYIREHGADGYARLLSGKK